MTAIGTSILEPPEATVERRVDEHPAQADALAAVLHALGDPMRLRIISQLSDGLEHRCGSLSLPISKSTCSHHFRVLREAGVISTRVEGKTRLNRLERERLDRSYPGLLSAVVGPRAE